MIQHELQRLHSILQSLQAGIWEWDMAQHSVMLNDHWAQMLGYTLQELQPITEQTSVQLCHPEDMARSSYLMKEHLAGRLPRYDCESRMRHKDGHWVWVHDSGCVVQWDSAGQPTKMVGVRQDISARKNAEDTARTEGERFMTLARISGTGVWEWDQLRQRLWCSAEYFTMLGRSPEDYLSEDGGDGDGDGDDYNDYDIEQVWVQLLHPDDQAQARALFLDYLASGAHDTYDNEFRLRHKNGSWVWIWSRGSALRDEQGQPTGHIIGTHINITNIRQAQALVRESQRRLERISNNIPDCMVFQMDCGVAGESRAITYVSQGVQRMHGLLPQAVLDNASLLYQQLLPEDVQRLQAAERVCIDNLSDFRVEARSRLPDGSLRWFMVVSSPRRLSNGRIVFDGIEMDITERKQREEEIHALNTQLEQRVHERTAELQATLQHLEQAQEGLLQSEKLAALGALVAGVAHELNTPIGNALTVATTLQNTQQRLQEQISNGLTRSALTQYLDDAQEGGQIIERNLQRAAELIGSFKQLATDQASTQRRQFSLATLVQEIELAMRPAIRRTPHQLHSNIPPHLALDSYPGPLGQVLMNLINNTLLHAFGQQPGKIFLQAQDSEPGWLRLSVSDNGCGIPPEHQKKIFDPFFTTKLGQGGSGLGLHITYTLITGLLGGRISLRSPASAASASDRGGTCFLLDLPCKAPQMPAQSAPAAP